MRAGIRITWGIGLILIGLILPAWSGLSGHPDISVRARPLRSHAGCIRSDAPPGQSFRCKDAGLKQIDVALALVRADGPKVELVLRDGGATGEILRRAIAQPGPSDEPELVSFSFEPVPESAGRWYHFQLLPSEDQPIAGYSPWVRFHGQVGRDDPWGSASLKTEVVEGDFHCPLANLRAVTIACEELSNGGGPVHFTLWDADDEGQTLRELDLPTPSSIVVGHAFFSFSPIPDSRGKRFGYRIESTIPARFVTSDSRPSIKTYHGLEGATARLGGMSSGETSLQDRDLVFRAWSSPGLWSGLQLATERAGWRLWAAVACWVLSVILLVRGFTKRAGSASISNSHLESDS